ncbi:hypothetical protein MNBD_ACTINO02-2507 [hydrothermal vent metagenome]|uniref:Lipoprotein n=1 Tax=hydrothermal vent metagenome TaxID=652676 RepID=A0A3B0SYK5_9ZZZZ
MHGRSALLLVGVAFVSLAAACSSSEAVTGSPEDLPTASVPDTELEATGPVYPVTQAALDAMPEAQAAAVADGTVTESEFERAILALVACLEESGVEVTDFSTKAGSWSIAYASVDEESLQEDAIYLDCYSTHVQDVESYYFAERQPSAEEDAVQHEVDRTFMIGCLQRAGVDVADDAGMEEINSVGIVQDEPAWARCALRMNELAGRF